MTAVAYQSRRRPLPNRPTMGERRLTEVKGLHMVAKGLQKGDRKAKGVHSARRQKNSRSLR